MRLKEIQAKCRTQETKTLTGTYPLKAVRGKPENNEQPKYKSVVSSINMK